MWVAHTSTSFVVSFSTLWWQSLKATRINFIKNNFFLLFVYTSAKRGVYLIKFYSDECLCWRQWERVHWNEEGDKNLMSSLMYHHHHHSWNCWIIKLSSKWNIMYTCVIYTTFSSSHISHIHLWNNCIRFFFFLCIYQKKICAECCCCYFSISIISLSVVWAGVFVVGIFTRTWNSDFHFLDEWICEFVYANEDKIIEMSQYVDIE